MKLKYGRTCLIGLGFMAILAFWQFYDQVIPYLLEYKFGLSTFNSNAVMSIDNVLAIFMLPLFGIISDRTKSRFGKRMPYIFFGTLASSILLLVLGLFVEKVWFTGFFVTLILLLIVMAIYRSPAVALMPDVTPKPLRSKANAVINLVGYLGGIFATVAMMFLLKSEKSSSGEKLYSDNQSFLPIFVVIALFMLISVVIMAVTVNENKLLSECDFSEEDEEETKSSEKLTKGKMLSLILILFSVFFWYAAYNGVTTMFSRYCVKIWHTDLGASSSYLLIATVVAIASFLPLGIISSKIGRKATVLAGVVAMAVCYISALFITHQSVFMYIVFAVVGIGWAAINVNSFPMVVDIAKGSDVGKYTGLYYTFSMAAQIVTPFLSAYIIETLGLGYKALFPYAAILMLLAFVTMSFVKHGDSKPKAKEVVIDALSGDN